MHVMRALRRRPLRALQIEVTSRCTRRCGLCLRDALADAWVEGDLSAAAWAAIEPFLTLAEHVHLQGWGEPLLHPRLEEMTRAAKRSGCTVGITTNGDLLPTACSWIVKVPVDIVTVSIAGDGARHAELRGGSLLDDVLTAASEVVSRRCRRSPRVQLSFLLTRDNVCGVEAAVRAAARYRLDEVFVTHLDCTPSLALVQAAAFTEAGLDRAVGEALAGAAAVAKELGVRLRLPAVGEEELVSCALDPSRFAFISHDGRLGPCVYLLPPVSGRIPRARWDGVMEVDPVVYGSVLEHSLEELLSSSARRGFTAPFEARRAAETNFRVGLGDLGFGTPALDALEAADRLRGRAFAANPFPEACRGCHKAAGW